MMGKYTLSKILEKHKRWLDGAPDGKQADLKCANLKFVDLQDADLRYVDLQTTDLKCANLKFADLRDTDLRGSDLQSTNLKCADLRGSDLNYADLRRVHLQGANLRGVNLDFSCWPLWCGSFDIKVDVRIARQLAYHLCRLDCDDKEYLKVKETLKDFANGFHRVQECGKIE